MAESIFTSQTPLAGNVNDGTTYTLGTVWTPAVDGTVTHIRVYAPTGTPAAAFVGVLYSITGEAAGSELARATFGALTPGAWNTVELPAGGVPVTAGGHYVACYITTDLFVLTTLFFTSGGVTNGNLTAIQSGSPYGNGRIHVGDGFPEIASGQQSCYFADVVFEVGGAPEVAGEGVGYGAGTVSAASGKTAAATGTAYGAATGQGAGDKTAAAAGVAYAAAAPVAASTKTAPAAGTGHGAGYAAAESTKTAAAAGSGYGDVVPTGVGVKVAQSAGVLYAGMLGDSGAAAPAARGPIVIATSAGPLATVHTRTTTVRLEVSAR